MIVSPEVRKMVENKIADCIAIAENHFGRTFETPSIDYKTRGRVAGWARGTDEVSFNGQLLMENVEEFVARTVPHEVAHCIDAAVNPEMRETTVKWNFNTGRVRRTNRSIHGPSWKAIMILFGAPTSRCHSYDVSRATVQRRRSTVPYVCTSCGKNVNMGLTRHRKMRAGVTEYFHKCGNRQRGIIKMAVETKNVLNELDELSLPIAAETTKPVEAPKARKETKMDICRRIFTEVRESGSHADDRHAVIARFMAEAGCTKISATKYFQILNRA